MKATAPEAKGSPAERVVRSAAPRGLERIREALARRLDQIEALARQRLATPVPAPEESAQAADRRHAEHEAWERARQAQLEQIESDRRLLTDAWDRLEQERIKAARGSVAAAQPAHRGRAAQPLSPPADCDVDDDVITRTIIRQFQTLRRDVRRNAESPPL